MANQIFTLTTKLLHLPCATDTHKRGNCTMLLRLTWLLFSLANITFSGTLCTAMKMLKIWKIDSFGITVNPWDPMFFLHETKRITAWWTLGICWHLSFFPRCHGSAAKLKNCCVSSSMQVKPFSLDSFKCIHYLQQRFWSIYAPEDLKLQGGECKCAPLEWIVSYLHRGLLKHPTDS